MRLLLLLALFSAPAFGKCIAIEQAPDKIGEIKCVQGKVLSVYESEKSGTFFLDFCADYRACPFTVVVFPRYLRDVGDVRMLAGRDVEIHGKITMYDGRAEIILKHSRQLKGESAKLPPMPREYDASRRGRYSAGTFRRPRSSRPQRDDPRDRKEKPEEFDPTRTDPD